MFPFKGATDYLPFTQSFYALVSQELDKAEDMVKRNDFNGLIGRMPGIISLVNCMGYLRGQDGFFLDERPQEISVVQKDLYQMEDACEARLQKLVDAIGDSELQNAYIQKLTQYYLKARTKASV